MRPRFLFGDASEAPGGAVEATEGAAIRLAVEVPIRVLSILTTLVLTRRLGVVGFGEFIATLGIGLIASELADLGLNQSLIPGLVSGRRSARDIFEAKARLTSVTLLGTAIALVAMPATSVVDPAMVGLCLLHYVGASWIECAGNTLRAHRERWREALVLLTFRGFLVLLIAFTSLGESARGVTLAYALSVIPGLVLAFALTRRHGLERGATSWRIVLGEALPLGLNSALARMNARVEVFVLKALDLATGLGLFAAGLRIIESLLTLPAALAGGALPSLARESKRPSHTSGAAQRTIGLIAWGSVPAATGISLRAPEILSTLGPGFTDGAPVLRVFAFTFAVCCLNTGLFHILLGAGEARRIPRYTAGRLAIGLLFALLLIPAYGGLGAAVGYATAEVLQLMLLARGARRHRSFSVARALIGAIALALPVGGALMLAPRALEIAIPVALGMFLLGAAVLLRGKGRWVGLG